MIGWQPMNRSSIKRSSTDRSSSQIRRWLLSIIRAIYSSDYLRFRIWAILILFLILVITGNLLTKNGLIFILIIIGYVLLGYLQKWLENFEK